MTPEAWIALIGVVGTLAGTLGSATLTNGYARRREQEQWHRHLSEQRRQERLDVCEHFATEAWLMAQRANPTSGELTRALTRLQLRTSGETIAAANRLYQACWDLSQQLRVAPSDLTERDERLEHVRRLRDEFLDVASREEEP
jgi:hypothetical protein